MQVCMYMYEFMHVYRDARAPRTPARTYVCMSVSVFVYVCMYFLLTIVLFVKKWLPCY